MATEFKVPELGENVEKGDVVRVMVKAGDTLAVGQPIFELETDKATIEVPSTVAGTITEVLIRTGDKVKPGQAVLRVQGPGSKVQGSEVPESRSPEIEAIRQVAKGRIIFPAAAQRWFMNQPKQETGRAPNDLSAREWEVIEWTARGMTNPEIAKSLGVSANTVRFHLKSIFGKIQVSNRTEAAAWYFAHKGG